jgi:hypothetical protein
MDRADSVRMAAGFVLYAAMAPLAASDFGLEYDIDRVPATQLSLADCALAIRRASAAAGYSTRTEQDQGRLVLHVAGPQGDGEALVSYCIQAGTRTVWVVQGLDYSGPGRSGAADVVKAVAAELRGAAGRSEAD